MLRSEEPPPEDVELGKGKVAFLIDFGSAIDTTSRGEAQKSAAAVPAYTPAALD